MALTPAERQANAKAKKTEAMDTLIAGNAALQTENTVLRSQNAELVSRVHALEIKLLKAQIKKSS